MSTQGEGIDMEQLYHDLAGVVIGHYLGDVNHATPMREIRRATEGAGAMIGRIFAVAEHEGLINANLLMEIRASEEDYKARLLHSARLFGPGQILRNHLEEVSARGGRHD